MKYSLRSLMIVLGVGPPFMAGGYFLWRGGVSIEVLLGTLYILAPPTVFFLIAAIFDFPASSIRK